MRARGFTLIETLITILLVSLVFGLFVLLLRDSFHLTRRMANKDSALRLVQVALDRMLTEAREADGITGLPGNQLHLTKVYAADADRCPAPLSYPLPLGYPMPAPPASIAFSPFANGLRRQVAYRLTVDGALLRETGPVGGSLAGGLELATGLSGLNCQWAAGPTLAPQSLLVLVFSFLDGSRLRSLKGMVVCTGIGRNP